MQESRQANSNSKLEEKIISDLIIKFEVEQLVAASVWPENCVISESEIAEETSGEANDCRG